MAYIPLISVCLAGAQTAVDTGLQVGRLGQAFAPLLPHEIVVPHGYRYGAYRLAFAPNRRHQVVGHAPERGFSEGLVGDILDEGLLLAVGLGGPGRGHDRAFIDTPGVL